MPDRRTQVVIVGGGPAGLLLSQRLHLEGIETILLERQSREHVLGRIRARVLEWGSVEVLRESGVGARMDREGLVHDGSDIVWGGAHRLTMDTARFVGRPMMAYGQTGITEDLYGTRDAAGGNVIDRAADVALHDVEGRNPTVTYVRDGEQHRIDCDFIAGCDGFHGVSRRTMPPARRREFEKTYPFGWLGILAETPPLPELVYANSPRGFALASQRGPSMSRYYVQCPLDTDLKDWPDERFWTELRARYPKAVADAILTGPSIEKSIAPPAQFRIGTHVVRTPLSRRRCGPHRATYRRQGAQPGHLGRLLPVARPRRPLLVVADPAVAPLSRAGGFDLRAQEQELQHMATSEAYMRAICEQYAGLPVRGMTALEREAMT